MRNEDWRREKSTKFQWVVFPKSSSSSSSSARPKSANGIANLEIRSWIIWILHLLFCLSADYGSRAYSYSSSSSSSRELFVSSLLRLMWLDVDDEDEDESSCKVDNSWKKRRKRARTTRIFISAVCFHFPHSVSTLNCSGIHFNEFCFNDFDGVVLLGQRFKMIIIIKRKSISGQNILFHLAYLVYFKHTHVIAL